MTSSLYVRARAYVALLLVLAFGCQDTGAPKLGYVPGGSGGSSTPTLVSYAVPLVIAGNKRMVWSGGATAAVLPLAAAGHAEGGQLAISFAANTATSLYLSPALNMQGDASIDGTTFAVSDWDATKAHELLINYENGSAIGSIRELAAADSTAPTISSAIVHAAHLDRIEATFAEPVWFGGATTGLSLTGTGQTITGVYGGDGTSAVTFTASGTLTGTPSLVVGSGRTAIDYAGNLLATGTTSVSIEGALAAQAGWSYVWERGTGISPSSGTLATWTEQIGGSLQIVPASPGGAVPAVTATGLDLFWDGGAHASRAHASVTLTTGTDWAEFVRVSVPAGTNDQFYALEITDGSTATGVMMWAVSNAIFALCTNGSDGSTSLAWPGGTFDGSFVSYWVKRVGTTLTLKQVGGSSATFTCATTLTGVTKISLGNDNDAHHIIVSDTGIIRDRGETGTEETNVASYIAGRP